ncbi:hypothetical protein [Fodinicurvata halophila]|uniref:hypothetical protein n=1 Tax=Fodinicurvata halophila TaxID=1419723 RepID=UPI00362C7FAE
MAAQFQSNIDPRPSAEEAPSGTEEEDASGETETSDGPDAEQLMAEEDVEVIEQEPQTSELSELEQQVAESLRREQINRKSDRYLRDLRRSANIDIRI